MLFRSIGLTSDGEYCDIELEGVISSADALAALNANSVKNITVTSFKELPNDAKNAMAAAAASDYDIFIAKDKYNIEEKKIISAFYEFISQNEIIVLKKSKRKEEKTDILPFIYGYRISCDDSGINIYLNLCAGSVNNIKPELVLESFFQYLGFDRGSEHIRSFAKINRIDTYCNIEGKFVSLGDIGSDIK